MKEDLMFCYLGNGLTVCDRNREKNNDYLTVAHIAENGKISWREKVSMEARERIERQAEEIKELHKIQGFLQNWSKENIYTGKLEEHNAKFNKDFKAFFAGANFKHEKVEYWIK